MSSKTVLISENEATKLGRRTVDIMVGAEEEIFGVHEDLIRASSPFFDKALNGPWKEASERTITMPEDEPKIMSLYVYWLYYRNLPALDDGGYDRLFEAYILGEKLLDLDFQNAIVDAIIERSKIVRPDGMCLYPGYNLISYAYSNSRPSAPIQDLLVDMHLLKGDRKWLHGLGSEKFPHAYLIELASRLLDKRTASTESLDPKKYHCDKKGKETDGKIEDSTD